MLRDDANTSEIEIQVDLSVDYQHQLLRHGCVLTCLPKLNMYDPCWKVQLPKGTVVAFVRIYGETKGEYKITFSDGFYFRWVYSEQDGLRWYSLNIPLQP